MFAFGAVSPVLAEHEAPRLGLTPIGQDSQYFDIVVEPGQTTELQVELANFGHDQVLARTFAADAYSIVNGGFGADLFGEPASNITDWLEYPPEELTLEPDEGLLIEFSLSVPAETPPGDYITALVAENIEPYGGSAGGNVAMEQVNRTAVAIAIDVPGPRDAALDIGAVGHKAANSVSFVTFEVANQGNVHLKPTGAFTLRDAADAELAAAPAIMDSVYGGLATLFEAPLAVALEPGDYCAELSLTDEVTGATDATECLPFTVESPAADEVEPGQGSTTIPVAEVAINPLIGNPIPALVIAAGLLLALLGIGWLVWRRRRQRSECPRSRAERRPWPDG